MPYTNRHLEGSCSSWVTRNKTNVYGISQYKLNYTLWGEILWKTCQFILLVILKTTGTWLWFKMHYRCSQSYFAAYQEIHHYKMNQYVLLPINCSFHKCCYCQQTTTPELQPPTPIITRGTIPHLHGVYSPIKCLWVSKKNNKSSSSNYKNINTLNLTYHTNLPVYIQWS